MFQFANFSEFLWMEGHGPYVWAAYAITFVGLLGIAWQARIARKNFLHEQASIARRALKNPPPER